jgi:hypothetical protein
MLPSFVCVTWDEDIIMSVGIATAYGLDDRGVGIRVPVRSSCVVQNGSGTHPVSNAVGTGGSFRKGKVAGV